MHRSPKAGVAQKVALAHPTGGAPKKYSKRSYAQWIDRLSPTHGHESLPVTGSKGAAFLSYASQDAEVARRICAALRAAGVEVWLDQSELRGGDAWDRQIKQQIHDGALLIPIISSTTQGRREGYLRPSQQSVSAILP